MKKIFFNGQIITMENESLASALLIEDGIIKATGTDSDILNMKDSSTSLIDLKGKTLMPSFIDSHSHLTAFANTLALVPLTRAKSFQDIISALSAFKKKNNLPKDKWIMGFGYDHNLLKERVHPSKEELDKVSLDNPILIAHASGHMGVVNSKALELLNITSRTFNPTGGLIGRIKGSTEPNGYLEENAFIKSTSLAEKPSLEDMINYVNKAEDIYASFGITTVQDGMVSVREFSLLDEMKKRNSLKLDVVGYVDLKNSKDILLEHEDLLKKYTNHFKLGGFKIFQDGSPQGRTAWLTKPYLGGEENYCGYPIYKDEEIEEFIKIALENDVQLLSHCNGDKASDQLINAYKKVLKEEHYKNDIRPVMVHAQTVRHDQLPLMKELNMIPSFFIAHVSALGDIHIKNLGMERASLISPANEALKLSLPITFHQDTPVMLPNMLHTVWTAVNRLTASGIKLGASEEISPYDALKAITINAAYQYFEEDTKGSLKPGKKADLVILDKNPLTIEKLKIKDIKVLETIKDGVTIFKA